MAALVNLPLFLVVVAAAAGAAATMVVSEEYSPGGGMPVELCGNDPSKLIALCKEYVKKEGPKIEPSKGCCGEVAKYDVQCVCKNIPKNFLSMISMDKAVFVARSCGKIVPKGMKCGSYIVPAAAV